MPDQANPSSPPHPLNPPNPAHQPPPAVPARMLNEYAYCPRLAYMMWVQQEWADNVETLEGKHAHRRVDAGDGARATLHKRSVHLTSEALGLTAVCDLVERGDGRRVRPVDYKRGKRPPVVGGAYEPERVQLCAQGLLLREHGFETHEGILYYVASKERVRVRFTPHLVERTQELLAEMRATLGAGHIPPPLEDSPKCPRCSLVSICLPEEVRFLSRGGPEGLGTPVRPLAASDPMTYPLVVQEPGARVSLKGERLLIYHQGELQGSARFAETSQVVLMGGAGLTAPALHECCQRGLPVLHLSGTGWFYGLTQGLPHKNVEVRAEQFAAARDPQRALPVAQALIAAKILNGRVFLRRNSRPSKAHLRRLKRLAEDAVRTSDAEALLGIEGTAARLYFSHFTGLLKGRAAETGAFDFEARNRHPPKDPINALLSLAYTLLLKDWVVTLHACGLDPMMGLYHQPRYGKPALALDMMEPFRPIVADSVVVTALNNGEVTADDFLPRLGGVLLKPAARKKLIAAYHRRIDQQIRHPIFDYSCTYRRIFEIQARLLGRYLLGELPFFRGLEVR